MAIVDDNFTLTLDVERPYIGRTPHLKMGELGHTLSRARRARAITLEDVERDTHVSRRYLQALENEDFSIFPAPVYARGFLRTYSRYLGLNSDELIRLFPNEDLVVDITPLPSVSRPPEQLINVNWLVAGLVAIFLLGAGFMLMQAREDPGTIASAQSNEQSSTQAATTFSGGQVEAPTTSSEADPVQGRAIAPIRPGQYPNFVEADKVSALAVLRDNDMNYMIVEVYSEDVPEGLVMSQQPPAGNEAAADGAITLVVSRGPMAPTTTGNAAP